MLLGETKPETMAPFGKKKKRLEVFYYDAGWRKKPWKKVLSHKTTSLCEMMANGGNLMAKQKKKLGC